MNFETVIGLEVHVELSTNSKIFSPASTKFGGDPNSNTNVIDWSLPGVLPVMNKGVIDQGIKYTTPRILDTILPNDSQNEPDRIFLFNSKTSNLRYLIVPH